MKRYHIALASLTFTLLASPCWAIPFGTFDPNSLAMGGAGVAMATGANAAYFNPAMLARYDVRKELAKHSHIMFPIISARYSETVQAMDDFKTANLDGSLSTAITNYNNATTPTAADAQAVANASSALQSGLDSVTSGPLNFDSNTGFVIGIPSKHQGGALFYNVRLVGDGVVKESAADRALLSTCSDTANIATCVATTPTFTSTANATAALLSEVGMSFAGEMELFHHSVQLGITPKYVKVNTYDLSTTATADSLTVTDRRYYDWNWNLDLGAAKQLTSQWRVGLALKNLISREYDTGIGNQVKISPQLRGGVAWTRETYELGLDLDLRRNRAVGAGDDTQDISLGGLWRMNHYFQFMGGLQRNLRATGDQKTFLYSVGMQSTLGPFQAGLTYAYNGVEKAASVQLGSKF